MEPPGHQKPMAAAVLHTLVARMGDQNAVVVSQKTLAALIGVTDRTIRNAIQVLVAENWVQVVRLNGPGTVSAYVVNSAVAWGTAPRSAPSGRVHSRRHRRRRRSRGHYAGAPRFAQDSHALSGERQLPTGPGEDPPSQPAIEGMEPDLPSLQAELEKRGQQRLLEE